MTEAADKPRRANRSEEELAMRRLVSARLRERWPTARIIHEPTLRYSAARLDLAAVTDREIIAVEIKSSRDVADRLEAQLRAFAPISTRIIVALAPKWTTAPDETAKLKAFHAGTVKTFSPTRTPAQEAIARVRADGNWHIETWTASAEAGTIVVEESASPCRLGIWPGRLLETLHVAELREILTCYPSYCHGTTNEHYLAACLRSLTTDQALRETCRMLRARDAYARGSDPPIATTWKSDPGRRDTPPTLFPPAEQGAAP